MSEVSTILGKPAGEDACLAVDTLGTISDSRRKPTTEQALRVGDKAIREVSEQVTARALVEQTQVVDPLLDFSNVMGADQPRARTRDV
jgi:hypothetical protein